MNNEIKEILDFLKDKDDYIEEYGYEYKRISLEHTKILLDYITNLQEENERLKELCDRYEEEHSTTFEYWKHLIKEDYKSRNEKAIECIKDNLTREWGEYLYGYEDLLNILNGDDEELLDEAE